MRTGRISSVLLLLLLAIVIHPQVTHAPEASVGAVVQRVAEVSRGGELVAMKATVTAYTAGYESCGKRPSDPLYGITASGRKVEHGTLAADPSIPFGTRIYVPEYGWGTVWDRGGAIKEGRIDVYIADLQDALRWGRREMTVYVLRDDR